MGCCTNDDDDDDDDDRILCGGYALAQVVEVLLYRPEGCGLDFDTDLCLLRCDAFSTNLCLFLDS